MRARDMVDDVVARVMANYRQLERRDQMVVLVSTCVLVAMILVFGVWRPLQNYLDDGSSTFESNQELLQWMRTTEPEARALSGTTQQRKQSGQSLLTLVSRSARSSGIKANKLQPEGDDSVSVWFESVAFNDLVRWLEKLSAEEEVQVRMISINRGGATGMVNARLVLRG